MFAIALSVRFNDVTGLNALDLRRRLGLPDYSRLMTYNHGDERRVAVDEAFARLHFNSRTARVVARTVGLDFLVPGDLVPDPRSSEDAVRINPEMAPERVRELWLAGK